MKSQSSKVLSRFLVLSAFIGCSILGSSQDASTSNTAPQTDSAAASAIQGVPRLVKFSGTLKGADGKVLTGQVQMNFAIYTVQEGGSPVWQEIRVVSLDVLGHYTVLLGSTRPEGLPLELFAADDPHWLSVVAEGAQDQPRTLLVSVPYALKAADADTLGGKPLSAFLMADSGSSAGTKSLRLAENTAAVRESTGNLNTGTANTSPNFLTKFDTGTSIVNSGVFEDNSGNVGIGTSIPTAKLDIGSAGGDIALGYNFQGTSQLFKSFGTAHSISNVPSQLNIGLLDGAFTGFSVQNVRDGSFNSASISFATHHGGVSVGTRMTIDKDGRVGVGTTTPGFPLEVVGTVKANTLSDGFISFGAAQINRNGGAVEFQFPGGAGNDVRFFSNAASPVSFLAGSGNVGIGIASPTFKLQVQGTAKANSFTDGFINMGLAQINRTGGAVELQLPGGSGNDVRMFSGTASPISFLGVNGNVGIGTNSPNSKLEVIFNALGAGAFTLGNPPPAAVSGNATATSSFVEGVLGLTSSNSGFGVLGENLASGVGSGMSAGVRGITALTTSLGTGVWGDALQTSGDNVGVFGHSASNAGTGVQGLADSATGDAIGVYGRSDSTGGTGVFGEVTAGTAASATLFPAGIYGKIASNAGAAGLFDTVNSAGNILVGRVGGSPVNVFRVDGSGKVFANGGTATSGADFAESVAVKDERLDYEAADIIAIDPTGTRRFTKVNKPYSTLVAGIYSTRPGVLATPHAADDPRHETEEIPLAIVGIVPCKVSSENGQINVGDLLVSSSTAGYAMKGTDRSRMVGAIVGKALQSMATSTGIIEVLVSLQ